MIHAIYNPRIDHYSVGSYYCCAITKEEWEELVQIKRDIAYTLPDGSLIIYMDNFPKDIISKYAKKVFAAHGGTDRLNELTNIAKDYKQQLKYTEQQIGYLLESHSLIDQ